jgi:D-serine deaminase-like pyridoxal phosphate-dependent protein
VLSDIVQWDIETPAVVVDTTRLERNLDRMQAVAATAGAALRPHAKTHKCLEVGRRQLAHGAVGLTVATLAEAEAFVADGCPSVFIAYPLWAGSADRPARLAALRERADLLVGVDSAAGAKALAAAVPGTRVMIEIDSGHHRSGIPVSEVTELATACRGLGLDVAGAFTHPGHSYAKPDAANVAAAAGDERAALAAAGAALEGVTDEAPVLSGGSSPTAEAGVAAPLTEARPGTYVFGDRQQMALAGLAEDDVALVVAARVVSAPRPGEAVLDCGSKALSSDRAGWLKGHGLILEAPEATIVMLSEEHAVVRGVTSPLRVGDLVRVIPNHVCTVVNLASEMLTADGDQLTGRWQVTARH